MLKNRYNLLILIYLIIASLAASAMAMTDTCEVRSQSEYQGGIVGSWYVTSGEEAEILNAYNLELRYIFTADNRVSLNIGHINNKNDNLYSAMGYYYIHDNYLNINFYYETDPRMGLVNNSLSYLLNCMSDTMFKDEYSVYTKM